MVIEKLTRAPSLYEMALDGIRSAIIDGTIELGEHLSEARVSNRFGISKTPVREALQELRREGLVQIDPQSGTRVFLPDDREIAEIFDMRVMLETGAAVRMFQRDTSLVAQAMADVVTRMGECVATECYETYRRLDSEFHDIIIAGSGNRLIVAAYRPLSSKIDALRSRGLRDIGVVRRSLGFHRRLADLLKHGAAEDFQCTLETHISNSSGDYVAWLGDRLSLSQTPKEQA